MNEAFRLKLLHMAIVQACRDIEDFFSVPVKVTILARDPNNPEMEVLVTSDTEDGIVEAVNRSRTRSSMPTSLADDTSGFRLKAVDRRYNKAPH